MTGEFDLIARYFKPLTMGQNSALGLMDDAAVLDIPAGYQVVVSSDTLNAGVHFFVDESPENIARKALRINLSDLAAMGAEPLSYQLNLALPEELARDELWLGAFSEALLADQKQFDIFCSGGDTTRINGDLSISITALGLVSEDKALKRSGAKKGDVLLVTGVIGDACIGLKIAQGRLRNADEGYFMEALNAPYPRIGAAKILQEYASAATDISDGLIADLGHICCASDVGVEVDIASVPLSFQAREVLENNDFDIRDLVTGGEDYELLIAVPPENLEVLVGGLMSCDIEATVIGRFTDTHKFVRLIDGNGHVVELGQTGWSHF